MDREMDSRTRKEWQRAWEHQDLAMICAEVGRRRHEDAGNHRYCKDGKDHFLLIHKNTSIKAEERHVSYKKIPFPTDASYKYKRCTKVR